MLVKKINMGHKCYKCYNKKRKEILEFFNFMNLYVILICFHMNTNIYFVFYIINKISVKNILLNAKNYVFLNVSCSLNSLCYKLFKISVKSQSKLKYPLSPYNFSYIPTFFSKRLDVKEFKTKM